jgi:hypothetical protein
MDLDGELFAAFAGIVCAMKRYDQLVVPLRRFSPTWLRCSSLLCFCIYPCDHVCLIAYEQIVEIYGELGMIGFGNQQNQMNEQMRNDGNECDDY